MKLFKNINLKSLSVRSVLDGTLFYTEIIKKNLIYIFFCALLLVFYIGNRYKCENQLAQIAKLEREITDLRYENITTSAELMSNSRQSEVARQVKKRGLGLEESIKAPQRIYLEKK